MGFDIIVSLGNIDSQWVNLSKAKFYGWFSCTTDISKSFV